MTVTAAIAGSGWLVASRAYSRHAVRRALMVPLRLHSCSGSGCHVLSASSVPLRLSSCSGFGCHVATREPLGGPFSLWWTGRAGGARHVRSAGGCSSCTEGFHFGYSCSGSGCHVLSVSSVPLRLRLGKGHSSPVAIRDAPVMTGRARSFSRGLLACTEGFHFGYSCSGCGCHVPSASWVPLRLCHRKGHSSPVAFRSAPVTTGRARSFGRGLP